MMLDELVWLRVMYGGKLMRRFAAAAYWRRRPAAAKMVSQRNEPRVAPSLRRARCGSFVRVPCGPFALWYGGSGRLRVS